VLLFLVICCICVLFTSFGGLRVQQVALYIRKHPKVLQAGNVASL
jgi:hypothetical protein